MKKNLIIMGFTFLFICSVFGQNVKLTSKEDIRIVKGTVTDTKTGKGIPDARIMEKETNNVTVSDSLGNYSIEVPIGATIYVTTDKYSDYEFEVTKCMGEAKYPNENNNCSESDGTKFSLGKIFKHTIPDNPKKSMSPYFFINSDDPKTDRMPLKSTDVKVNIAGSIADVSVKQIYINEGSSVIEAVYIFPGSTRAAVYGMNMKVGGRLLKAQIKEKEEARMMYEKAKAEGKTATLLEQQRPNVFQMNIANILPGDTIEVEMFYTEMLESKDGIYEFVYPTVVGPRYANENISTKDTNWVSSPYLQEGVLPTNTFHIETNINSAISLKNVLSPSHNVNVNYPSDKEAKVSLAESEKNRGNKDFIIQYHLRGDKVESGILLYEHGDENFFAYVLEPPLTPKTEDIPKREYIFIIDVSGSMSGYPLDISKEVFNELMNDLSEKDKFNVVFFAGSSSSLFPESEKANELNILKAKNFFSNVNGGGGTELLPALKNAMSAKKEPGYSRTFVIVTDGYVTVEKEAFNLVKQNLNSANFFAFGIGSSVNRYLIEGLANAGQGEAFIVENREDAPTDAHNFAEMLRQPVLTDIKMTFDSIEVYDVEPQSIPDIFAKRPLIIYGKYRGKPTGTVHVEGVTGDRLVSFQTSLDSTNKTNNQALRYLWARNKLKYLSDYAGYYEENLNYYNSSQNVNTANRKDRIVKIGLQYNLLSEYTSFIAVDDTVRNKSKKSETVKQPLPLPEGVSNNAVGEFGSETDFGLNSSSGELNSVVKIGYGMQRKEDVTSSISSIKSADISMRPVIGVDQALQGKVSGVQVQTNSGTPGGETSVNVRGISSLNNSEPLYIVDGVPVISLSNVSTSAIKSISILKDASACAIYGARGANGVIIITTKNPPYIKPKPLSILYRGMVFKNEAIRLPKIQDSYGDTISGGWGAPVEGITGIDNVNNFFNKGYGTNNSLGISGASKSNTILYNINFENTTQDGVFKGGNFKKNILGVGLGYNHKRIKLNAGLTYLSENSNYSLENNFMTGVLYGIYTKPNNSLLQKGDSTYSSALNSYDMISQDNYHFSRKNIQPRFSAEFDFLDSVSHEIEGYESFLKYDISYISAENSIFMNYNPFIDTLSSNNTHKDFNSLLLYNFSKKFFGIKINSITAFDVSDQKEHLLYESDSNYSIANERTIFEAKEKIEFDFQKKVILGINFGGTYSSTYTQQSLYPAGAVTCLFKIHKTNFFRNTEYLRFISNLRIRVSAGILYNEYPISLNYSENTSLYDYSTVNTFLKPALPASQSDILPEQKQSVNASLYIDLFKSKLNFNVSYSYNRINDAIIPVQTNDVYLFDNIADIEKSVFDISLAYYKHNYLLSCDLKLGINKYKTNVLSTKNDELYYFSGFKNAGAVVMQGESVGAFYGTRSNDSTDVGIVGDPTPDFTLYFNPTFTLKRLELAFQLDWKKGGDVLNLTQNNLDYLGLTEETVSYREVNGQDAAKDYYSSMGELGVTSNAIEDASYLRLSEITLGYTFKNKYLTKLHIEELIFSVYARNLFIISDSNVSDPNTGLNKSINSSGIDYYNMPLVKTVGFSLSLKI